MYLGNIKEDVARVPIDVRCFSSSRNPDLAPPRRPFGMPVSSPELFDMHNSRTMPFAMQSLSFMTLCHIWHILDV